jgi:3-oxoacyl-[acyl-carrier protein] reductase
VSGGLCSGPHNVYAVHMMLEGKVAVVHGAGGAVGTAVADASRRSRPGVESVHAMDETEVDAHAQAVVALAGRIDIAFNAVGVDAVQGVPLLELGYDDFLSPIIRWTRSQFITSRAAARHMVARGQGTVLTLSPSTALPPTGTGGFGVACAAIEQLTRSLAAELGPSGVRAVCLRIDRASEPLDEIARTLVLRAAYDVTAPAARS